MPQTWLDPDGLYRRYGTDKVTADAAGEYKTFGPLREVEVKIDLTALSTSAQTILSDNTFLPAGVVIEEIVVEASVAATSGGAATLDVGLIRTDRSTELDYDGFVAAMAKGTIDTAGKKVTLVNGSTAAGALIGTTLANIGYLVAKAGTAVFTAGTAIVRIRYRK